jgi:hypothetical protein
VLQIILQALLLEAGLWIRIDLNPDPDPVPNPAFDDQKFKKIYS